MKSSACSPRLSASVFQLFGAIALGGLAMHGSAGTIFDELASNTDLSNVGTSPTPLNVLPGINNLFGVTGSDNGEVDRDYFTFTVPAGYDLVAIAVLGGTQPIGDLSFFGLQAGSQFTVDPESGSADGLLGYVHYNALNGDILPGLALAKSPQPPGTGTSTGFTPPLHAGPYSFWVQEFGDGESPYGFAFQIKRAVPDAGLGLWGTFAVTGSLLLFGTRRRSEQS